MPDVAQAVTEPTGVGFTTLLPVDLGREPNRAEVLPPRQDGNGVLDRPIGEENARAVLPRPGFVNVPFNIGGGGTYQQIVNHFAGAPLTPATMRELDQTLRRINAFINSYTVNQATDSQTVTLEIRSMSPVNWPITWLTANNTATNSAYDTTWAIWSNNATTGVTTVTNVPWLLWNNQYEAQAMQRTATAEQRQRWAEEETRQKALYEERQRQYAIEAAARKVAADKAQGKAVSLLLSALTEEQRRDLLTKDYFFVNSQKGNLYRVDRGNHLNVRLVDRQTRKVIRTYCSYATDGNYGTAPDGDSMLAQKLMLECMEDQFLKVAIAHDHEPTARQFVGREDFIRHANVGPLAGAAQQAAQA